MTRNGDWIQTYPSGGKFYPLDPRPEDIDIRDIAHALSNICRFGGHVREFYSVSQHSLLVSSHVPRQDRLYGLLHDAAEAYLVDIPRPIKRSGYLGEMLCDAEKKIMDAIRLRFGLSGNVPPSVEALDRIVLATEKRDLLKPEPEKWMDLQDIQPLVMIIMPMRPVVCEREFLREFYSLYGREDAYKSGTCY